MTVRRWIPLIGVLAIATNTLIACGKTEDMTKDPMEDNPTNAAEAKPDWVIPPLPLEEQLLQAQFVVKGTILSDGEQSATLQVSELLLKQSEADPGSTVEVAHGRETSEGHSGIWLLGPGDPHEVLLGPADVREAEIRRIFAGQSRLPDPPDADEIRALAQQADRIVFARLTASAPDEAEAVVDETIKGDGAATFEVVRPPGRTWDFPTEAPSYGVIFVRSDGNRWVVLNTQEPSRYGFTAVTTALG